MRWTQDLIDREAGIREAFFAAMMTGYATEDVETFDIPGFPRAKAIPFEQGDYQVWDWYFTAENSRYSSGTTMIWCKGQPVWSMYYQGWYVPEAIPFLKQALKANYQRSVFLGGRGPKMFQQGRLKYHNNVDETQNVFSHFAGQEVISYIGGVDEPANQTRTIGMHEYKGMMYLPMDAPWPAKSTP